MQRRQRRFDILVLLLGVLLALTGCGQEDIDISDLSLAYDTPADMIRSGDLIYQRLCFRCHKKDGIGEAGLAPSLTSDEFLSTISDSFLIGTIHDGRPASGMPTFAKIGDLNIRAVVAYLRSYTTLPDISAQLDAQPASQGDPVNGQELFKLMCSRCHGVNGDGYIYGGTGPAIGRASFLDRASDGYIRTTIKEGRGYRMPSFIRSEKVKRLSDPEVEDIVAYLRQIRH